MSIADYYTRHIPEYYDFMYLDGFEPWEIQVAHDKRIRRLLAERRAAMEAEKEIGEIKITSEVKIKK